MPPQQRLRNGLPDDSDTDIHPFLYSEGSRRR